MLAGYQSVFIGLYDDLLVQNIKILCSLWYSVKVSYILLNIIQLILNITWQTVVWGSINVYWKSSISKKKKKKEKGTNLSETRLSETVSANLMQQIGSWKDTWYINKNKNKNCLCMSFILSFSDDCKYFWEEVIPF